MRRMIVPGAAAVIVLVLLLAGWAIVSPGWAIGFLAAQAEQQLGRKLEVKGGAALELSPRLAVRLDRVSLSNPDGLEGSFITARALRIPLAFGDLFRRSADLSTIDLEGAEIALLVNERNDASWDFPAVKTPAPLRLSISDSAMRFFDARSAQAFSLAGARMVVDIGVDGEVTVTGSADMGGRLAKIDAALKSLSRVQDDGSPLDLGIAVPDGAVQFSGRLSTANLLSLAGPVTITSPDLRAAARWAGLDIPAGATAVPLALTGALESAGRAFAIRRGEVRLGPVTAQGDVVLDLRNPKPKLDAVLGTPALALDGFVPESGRRPGQWGTLPIDLSLLKALDMDISVEAGSVTMGQAVLGPARVTAGIAEGRLTARIVAPATGGGSIDLETSLDAGPTPPAFSLAVNTTDADVRAIVPMIADLPWLTGKGNLNARLSGSGRSQQEIIGTLAGNISLSLADGALAGPDLRALLAAVSQRIIEGWTGETEGQTTYRSFSIETILKDGIATIESDGAMLNADGIIASAAGNIDLLRRAVNLKVLTRVADGAGAAAALPVPVIVRGPWDKPRIYPDLPDVLAKPAEAFARLKAMGLPAAD